MRSNASANIENLRVQPNVLLRDLHDAGESLRACLDELEQVLARPQFDAGALTSIRLKLAGLRLTRGPLVIKVFDLLSGNVTEAERAIVAELRSSHWQSLRAATEHTAKWTLEAIAKNWIGYRRETRKLMSEWLAKAEREQRLLYPLMRKCA